MTKTPDLIDALVECATPVRRLRPPLVRAGLWLALAAVILALLAVGHGVRADLVERLHQPVFAVSIAAALATGNPGGRGGVHGQSSRPPAMVAGSPCAGAGGVGRHHRLWLPDGLGRHRPGRRPLGRNAAMFRDPRAHQRAAGNRACGDAALRGAAAPRRGHAGGQRSQWPPSRRARCRCSTISTPPS